MMKRIMRFLKSSKGSHAIEAMIITPIWLIVILYCGYTQTVSVARQVLADESSAISNIISLSENENDARSMIVQYVDINNLDNKFNISGGSASFITIVDTKNQKVSDKDWIAGKQLYVYITVQTAFTGINFNSIKIGDNEIKVFSETFTNKCLITLNNGR